MKLKSYLVVFLFLIFTSGCENDGIADEIMRLKALEKELIQTISEKKTEKAKILCIQMKWEYVATTVGAAAKCKMYADIWDDKRRNYLKAIGINPIEVLGEKPMPKPQLKTFEERIFDTE